MEIQVSTHDWLALPMAVRAKLKEIFNIPKSQGSWVEGSIVRSDGHTYQDLQAITVEKMQIYLALIGTEGQEIESDFVTLFHACLNKIEQQIAEETAAAIPTVDPHQVILDEWAMNITRMGNQAATLGLNDQFKLLISKFLPDAKIPRQTPEVKQKGTQGRRAKTA